MLMLVSSWRLGCRQRAAAATHHWTCVLKPNIQFAFEYMQPGFVLVVMPPAAGVMHAVRQGYLKNMYFGIAQDAAATHLLEVCTPKDAARAFSTGYHNIAACAGLCLCTQAVGQLCQCEASHACSQGSSPAVVPPATIYLHAQALSAFPAGCNTTHLQHVVLCTCSFYC